MRAHRKNPFLAIAALLAGVVAVGCEDVPVHQIDDVEPAGIVRGTVVYIGPPPCTQSVYNTYKNAYETHVVGSAVLLVFETKLLPPPEGLGTSARSLAVVSGDELFAGVQGALGQPPDGGTWCPAADAAPIQLSATWAVGPLTAGQYQIRGFYDYDGDFSPILKIHQLPTKNDVGGGALANAAAAATGAKPIYQTITIGVPDASGQLVVPDTGALVDGVTVTLGKVLPLARPVTNIDRVVDERPTASSPETDPTQVTLPVDQGFSLSPTNPANAAKADKEFLRIALRPGVPEAEQAAAVAPPISIEGVQSSFTIYPAFDDAGLPVLIPETPRTSNRPKIPDLFPQAIFAKLDPSDATGLTAQASPAVLINGLVINETLIKTTTVGAPKDVPEILVGLRPSAICTKPLDANGDLLLVTPSFTAQNGDVVIGPDDISVLKQTLGGRLGKDPSKVQIVEGCLPPGKFAINLVYDTGQAWTIPNEAGVCQAPLEQPTGDGHCVEQGNAPRPLLPSQNATIRVGGASNAGFCDSVGSMNHGDTTDSHGNTIQFVHGVPTACLTDDEIAHPEKIADQIR